MVFTPNQMEQHRKDSDFIPNLRNVCPKTICGCGNATCKIKALPMSQNGTAEVTKRHYSFEIFSPKFLHEKDSDENFCKLQFGNVKTIVFF